MALEKEKLLNEMLVNLKSGVLPTEQDVYKLMNISTDEGVVDQGVMYNGRLYTWKEINEVLLILDKEANQRFTHYNQQYETAFRMTQAMADPDSKRGRYRG